MQLLFFPTMSSFFVIITTVFLGDPTSVYAQNDAQYQNCSAKFDCGNITAIGYPFWGSNRPEYCGHPKFELNCSDETAQIKIKELNYRVIEINSDSNNLKVVREDYIGDICPGPPHVNTTLDWEVLSYASDIQNVTLYYGCPGSASIIPTNQSNTFSCDDGTGFFMTRDLGDSTLKNYAGSCATKVLVPASQSAIEPLENNLRVNRNDLLVAFEQGFGLQWNANNSICETCSVSGGVCGCNSSTSSFTCYCSNSQPQPFSCGGTASNQPQSGPVKILFGVLGALEEKVFFECYFLHLYLASK